MVEIKPPLIGVKHHWRMVNGRKMNWPNGIWALYSDVPHQPDTIKCTEYLPWGVNIWVGDWSELDELSRKYH
jgi:hypothetical protein